MISASYYIIRVFKFLSDGFGNASKIFIEISVHSKITFFGLLSTFRNYPVDIYLLKVINRNTGTWCEICSKTIKTPYADWVRLEKITYFWNLQ